MLCLDIHNRSQEECLVSPVAISRAGCIYSFSNSIYLFHFSPLWLSWDSQETGSCSPAAGFCRRILSFLWSFSPSLFPVAHSLLCLQPAVASHPQPTAFVLQKLPSCVWSYWILPCLSWRSPGVPRQPFSILSYPFLWPLQTSDSLTRVNSQIILVSPASPESTLQRWEVTPLFIPSELTWEQRLQRSPVSSPGKSKSIPSYHLLLLSCSWKVQGVIFQKHIRAMGTENALSAFRFFFPTVRKVLLTWE